MQTPDYTITRWDRPCDGCGSLGGKPGVTSGGSVEPPDGVSNSETTSRDSLVECWLHLLELSDWVGLWGRRRSSEVGPAIEPPERS